MTSVTPGGEKVVAEYLQVVLDGVVSDAGAKTVDGRVRRGAENRSALVEALVSLYEEGELSPTATQIAQRAGVAVRSVYGHFGDVETLAAEVSQRQWQVHRGLKDAEPIVGSLDDRIEELVARRAELFEAVAPVRRGDAPCTPQRDDCRQPTRARAAIARPGRPDVRARARPCGAGANG